MYLEFRDPPSRLFFRSASESDWHHELGVLVTQKEGFPDWSWADHFVDLYFQGSKMTSVGKNIVGLPQKHLPEGSFLREWGPKKGFEVPILDLNIVTENLGTIGTGIRSEIGQNIDDKEPWRARIGLGNEHLPESLALQFFQIL